MHDRAPREDGEAAKRVERAPGILRRALHYSLKHCPGGDDPGTETVDETDCGGTLAAGGRGTGSTGNLCHVDCSNRGKCDYLTGTCACFLGYHGANCATRKVAADGAAAEE